MVRTRRQSYNLNESQGQGTANSSSHLRSRKCKVVSSVEIKLERLPLIKRKSAHKNEKDGPPSKAVQQTKRDIENSGKFMCDSAAAGLQCTPDGDSCESATLIVGMNHDVSATKTDEVSDQKDVNGHDINTVTIVNETACEIQYDEVSNIGHAVKNVAVDQPCVINSDCENNLKQRKGVDSLNRTSAKGSIPIDIRGKPKSGRFWKSVKDRKSSIIKVKSLKTSWQKKMRNKQEMKMVKAFVNQIKDEKQKEKEDLKKRQEENKKRREENAKKSEVVQVIKNTAKLKRMKKKQLRKIEKRDLSQMKTV